MPSTAIQTFSYDEQSRTLFVTFVDGDLYAYFDVEPRVFNEMRAAFSKGRYFAYKIRNRYRYRKMDRPEQA